MARWRPARRWVMASALGAGAVLLAACSSSPSPSASSTTSTSAAATSTTTSASRATTTTTTTGSATTTTGTILPQSQTSTEFYAPSGNLECEIDNQFGSTSITSALCLTETPPQSVTLGADSTLKECTGTSCLSNAGLNTPMLPYGSSITLGPFTCLSMSSGMKCTLASGNGFVLARSGVTRLGNVSVVQTTSNV